MKGSQVEVPYEKSLLQGPRPLVHLVVLEWVLEWVLETRVKSKRGSDSSGTETGHFDERETVTGRVVGTTLARTRDGTRTPNRSTPSLDLSCDKGSTSVIPTTRPCH